MNRIPDWITNTAASIVVCGMLLGITGFMQQREAEIEAQHQATAGCIPSDAGEITIQRIDHGVIRCEKHARLDYPHAQVPTLICPIKGACSTQNMIHLTRSAP